MTSKSSSNLERRERARAMIHRYGFTLIEVVAGLALLATLLVALLTARAGYTRQYQTAERRLAAVAAADELLRQWWREPKKFPRADMGQTPGPGAFRWRTREVENGTLEELQAQLIRLELFDAKSPGSGAVVAIDVVLPKEVTPHAIAPR